MTQHHARTLLVSILIVLGIAAVLLESIRLDDQSHARAIYNCELTAQGRAAGKHRADAINAGFATIEGFIRSAAVARRAEARDGGPTARLSAAAAARYAWDAKRLSVEIHAISAAQLPDPNCEENAP